MLFFALNEICRPLMSKPSSSYSKIFRHAVWGFLKSATRVRIPESERRIMDHNNIIGRTPS